MKNEIILVATSILKFNSIDAINCQITHSKILLLSDPFADMKSCNEDERRAKCKAAQAAVLPNSFGGLSKHVAGTTISQDTCLHQ